MHGRLYKTKLHVTRDPTLLEPATVGAGTVVLNQLEGPLGCEKVEKSFYSKYLSYPDFSPPCFIYQSHNGWKTLILMDLKMVLRCSTKVVLEDIIIIIIIRWILNKGNVLRCYIEITKDIDE